MNLLSDIDLLFFFITLILIIISGSICFIFWEKFILNFQVCKFRIIAKKSCASYYVQQLHKFLFIGLWIIVSDELRSQECAENCIKLLERDYEEVRERYIVIK